MGPLTGVILGFEETVTFRLRYIYTLVVDTGSWEVEIFLSFNFEEIFHTVSLFVSTFIDALEATRGRWKK